MPVDIANNVGMMSRCDTHLSVSAVSFIGWSGAGFVIGKPGMVTLNGKNLECYNWQDDKLIKAERCSKEQETMGKEARAQRAISEFIVRKGLNE